MISLDSSPDSPSVLSTLETLVRKESRILDWATVRIPERMPGEPMMREWLAQGMHADMAWLETHMEVRANPALLWPGMHTVIMFLWELPGPLRSMEYSADIQIASYAQGADYHVSMGRWLDRTRKELAITQEGFVARTFVDAMPVLEREFALLAGLGWKGKNSMLLHPKHGSAFLLGGLACNMELVRPGPHPPGQEFCRTCTLCIKACPTGAIGNDRTIDSRKCLSWMSIEKTGEFSSEQNGSMDRWLFGCDICQSCCPWNSKKIDDNIPAHWPKSIAEWEHLLQPGNGLRSRIKQTPLGRTGRKGLERNLRAIRDNEARITKSAEWPSGGFPPD
jgi:epoxyqueuosine reductase